CRTVHRSAGACSQCVGARSWARGGQEPVASPACAPEHSRARAAPGIPRYNGTQGPCTVAWSGSTSRRAGPGEDQPRRSSLPPDWSEWVFIPGASVRKRGHKLTLAVALLVPIGLALASYLWAQQQY